MAQNSSPNHTYLAFDLGSSNSRAVVGWLSGDQIQLEVVHRFITPIIDQSRPTNGGESRATNEEESGQLYWDLGKLWQELQTGFCRTLEFNPNLCSLSVDSWGFDYVPLNISGQRLRNAYCYRSPRTEGLEGQIFETINESLLYEVTGTQFLPFNTLCQVIADREQTNNRLMIADYFNYRFAGRAVSEVSLASTTGLLNVYNRTWSTEVMNQLGIPTDSWPEIVPDGTIIGSVNNHPSVSVIASCSHDTACAVAAVPVAENSPPWAYLSCGSWSLLGIELNSPITTETARQYNFTNEVGVDGTVRFLTNLTGLWILQQCELEWPDLGVGEDFDYDTLLEEASAAPPNPEIVIDFNQPIFQSPGNMIQKIQDYCRQHGMPVPEERGEIVRAILFSLASSYNIALRNLEEIIGEEIQILHIVGGGVRNHLLCQFVADVCQRTVIAGPTEATTMGNLLIQARTMGHLPTNISIRDVVRNSTDLDIYHPS
ncbi:MAG: FGGY-family carbohydrate kinase [Crocosphaera sp.]|nr:FGGY-family carbohydrate kinase [Crocosphaera sp.]